MKEVGFIALVVVSIIVVVFSFLRTRINYKLYNSEYGTNFKPLGIMQFDGNPERLACQFKYFYWKVKPQNKRLAIINNIMSGTIIICILSLVILNLLNK